MNYEVAWLLEIAAHCVVNCYAIISGYISYETKFKYSRIISLWFQVILYTVIITIGFAIFMPEVVGIKDIVKAFIPTITNQYWYFSAYFGMFFFIPFLNYLLENLEKRKMTILIITIVCLFSIVSIISRYTVFSLGGGYSMVWLSALYLIGGYIKKYDAIEKIKVRWLVAIYLIAILTTWSSKFVMEAFTSKALGFVFGSDLLVNYLSPTILIAGVSLVILFARLEIHSKTIVKLITFFAPVSFGVYLIHTHPLVYQYLLGDRYVKFANLNPILLVIEVCLCAITIYIICSSIDWIRLALFKKVKIHKLSEIIEGKLQKFFLKIIRVFEGFI